MSDQLTMGRLAQLDQKRRLEDALARLATMNCRLCGEEVTGYEAAMQHDTDKHPETL